MLNPIDESIGRRFDDLKERFLGLADGTASVTVDSDAMLQFYINDSNKVLHATDEQLPTVLAGIGNHVDEIQHPKIKQLYYPLVAFAYDRYQKSQTIKKLQHEVTSFMVGNQDGSLVQTDQITNARNVMTDILSLKEDIEAENPLEVGRIEFEYKEVSCYVTNFRRDKIFRYWYINRRRHYSQNLSNRQIAKEMEIEINIDSGYAAKTISHIHKWFAGESSSTWLCGDYIMRTQMYFCYRGYTNLPLNYCYQPPNEQQIITLGQQLHVSTRDQEED